MLIFSTVEYCSYKGLTLNTRVFFNLISYIVEYCSYKGLTLETDQPHSFDNPQPNG